MDTHQSNTITPSFKIKITSFLLQSKRVWLVLRKPDMKEFSTIAKISALGILVVGIIGFFISDIMKIF